MITNKNVMLFFRDQGNESDVNGIDDMLVVPAGNLMSMNPNSNTTIKLHFKSVKNNHNWHSDQLGYDTVDLNITQGKAEEAMKDIVRTINSAPHGDGFVVIADDMNETDSDTSSLNNLTRPTKYCSTAITSVNAINVNDELYRNDLPSLGTGNVAPTPVTGAGALTVNTHHTINASGATAFTIPAATSGKAGDWITATYIGAIGNGNLHSYTCTTDTQFTLGSRIYVPGQDGTRITVIDTSVADDDRVSITGLTNGDGGIGTTLKFVNTTGKTNGWSVYAVVQGQGAMSAASATTVFADS